MDKKDIEKIIVDSLFISERKSGNTLVDVPGMRGWSSPFDEPYANRISLIDGADVEHAIQGAIGFFKSKNSGFTWVVRPADIDAQIPEKLLLNGFVPSKFHKVAGMCLKSPIAAEEENPKISVREITGDDIVANIEIISRAYGNTSQEYTRYLYTPSADQDGVVSRMYLAYLQDTDEPIGYGYCSYIENNSVLMLRGAAVVPEHRGKGAYKELLRQRLSDASAEGIEKFIIQSARDSSYSACLRFGFKEICPLELYQWSPS